MLNNFRVFKKYGIYTPVIRIEASSVCQLRCPCCHQATGDKGIIKPGHLSFENFKWFIENYPEFKRIEMSCWGEPFLNPNMDTIMALACEKNIDLSVGSGTNLNTISDETLENLVKYKFKKLQVALDGVDNDVYRIYRQNGDFDTVIRNIKKLNEFKKKRSSRYPELTWQYIVFGHNEHQIEPARKMAAELGMVFDIKMNGIHSYSPVKNKDVLIQKFGAASPREYWLKKKETYLSTCSSMWTAPQISWDGQFLGCCANKWGSYGNVFESGLEACLKNPDFIYAKQMVTGAAKAKKGIPCSVCRSYTHKIKEGPLCKTPGFKYLAYTILKR